MKQDTEKIDIVKSKKLELLKNEILACRICREKFGFEPHPVFLGKYSSKIMQISQAPSRTVHKTLKPFDDASGKKLRDEWYCITPDTFYNTDNFYMSEISHCYPGKSPNGGDRIPPKSCADRWLYREIDAVDNEIFILIGKYAADYFFPKENFTRLVFTDKLINGKPAYILPHPSPLNSKWLKDNPEFLSSRMPFIREQIHKTLKI